VHCCLAESSLVLRYTPLPAHLLAVHLCEA
jgi:hypothetical protein